MDTNGSTESFELVTEDNNGEGKAKTDGGNRFSGHNLKSEKEEVCVCEFSVLSFCTFSAPSSEDEWVPLELCFGMPLFSSELNRRVCRKIASHKLCSSER